jgi:hypothetical protein
VDRGERRVIIRRGQSENIFNWDTKKKNCGNLKNAEIERRHL